MTTKEEIALLRAEVERLSHMVQALAMRPPQTVYVQPPNMLNPQPWPGNRVGDPPGYYSTSLRGRACQ